MTNDELGVFYKKFFKGLYHFAKKLTKHHQDAEDLVQDAFVSKLGEIETLRNNDLALFEYFKNAINWLYLTEKEKVS